MALAGATLQMVSHGLSTGALFLLVGMLIERRKSSLIADYGGVASQMPRFTVLFWIALFASIGLPGLSGFVGEFLILQGAMEANFVYAFAAAIGVILGAVYMLKMFGATMFGVKIGEKTSFRDAGARENFCGRGGFVFSSSGSASRRKACSTSSTPAPKRWWKGRTQRCEFRM